MCMMEYHSESHADETYAGMLDRSLHLGLSGPRRIFSSCQLAAALRYAGNNQGYCDNRSD